MGEFHAVAAAVQFGDGMHAAAAHDEALALQVALDRGGRGADETAVDDGAAGGQGTGDDLAAGVGRVEVDGAAAVHIGARGRHDDRVEGGHGAFAVEVDAGIGFQAAHALEQDVVVLEHAPGFHHARRARPHGGGVAPVVDHGEGELAALFHIVFGDAQMRGVIAVLGGGAAAQDVELGAFFHHHDVVHGLSGGIALDEHAGLHGLADLHALAGTHEVAAVEVLVGHAGDLVLVGIEQLPVVLRQAVELFEGRADVHEVQAFLPGGAVHVGMVELHEGAADLVVVHVDTGQDQALLVFLGQTGQIFDGGGILTAAEVETGKVDAAHTRGASAILPYMSPARQRRHSW